MRIIANITGIVIYFLVFWVAGTAMYGNWQQYDSCPAGDVLSWDANLRFTYAMDQYQDLQRGNIKDGIIPLLDSPTWPPLRIIFSLLVYPFLADGPSQTAEVAIGSVFFPLLVIFSGFVAFRITRSFFAGSLITATTSILLLQAEEIPAYALSAMMEIQGMFFFLAVSYFLFSLYRRENEYFAEKTDNIATSSPRIDGQPFSNLQLSGLFLSAFGLFMTKYPYGIMLLIALVPIELFRNSSSYKDFILFSLEKHYLGWRLIFLLLCGLTIFLFAIEHRIEGLDLGGQGIKYSLYAIFLILLIDFQGFIWKYRRSIAAMLPQLSIKIYLLVFLPMIIWFFIHPDRFSAFIGAQQYRFDEVHTFTYSALFLVFQNHQALLALLVSFLLILFGAILPNLFRDDARAGISDSEQQRKRATNRLLSRKNPFYLIILLILINFLLLELMTGNKQHRHIFHLLPAILVFGMGMTWIQGLRFLRASEGGEPRYRMLASFFGMFALFLALVGIMITFLSMFEKRGLLSGTYRDGRILCFTGYDSSPFEPARWVARQIPPDSRGIWINTFHDGTSTGHGRMLASDVDMLVRIRTFSEGYMRNDSVHRIEHWDADYVYVLHDCTDAGRALLNKRATELGHVLKFDWARTSPQGVFCLEAYQLSE